VAKGCTARRAGGHTHRFDVGARVAARRSSVAIVMRKNVYYFPLTMVRRQRKVSPSDASVQRRLSSFRMEELGWPPGHSGIW
jgi:hypothetical protein